MVSRTTQCRVQLADATRSFSLGVPRWLLVHTAATWSAFAHFGGGLRSELNPGRPVPVCAAGLRDRVRRPTSRVLRLVGHEPQLSEIAQQLLKRRFRSLTPETPSAGVTCIRLGVPGNWQPQVRWVIEPTEPDVTDQLRKKIASKIDVAKVFGSVVTLLLGFVMHLLMTAKRSGAEQPELTVTLSAAALAGALVRHPAYSLPPRPRLDMPALTTTGRKIRKRNRERDIVHCRPVVGPWDAVARVCLGGRPEIANAALLVSLLSTSRYGAAR